MNIALIPLFPLIGFLINGAWYAFAQAPKSGHRASAGVTGAIASVAIFASFVVSLVLFVRLTGMPEDARVIEQNLYDWMTIGKFNFPVVFRVDALSTLFTLVITGVGTLIHVYSIGYMSHDETPGKFFCYLNLFCFAMLVLVLGGTLPLMFLGWEGVGLCSYLLIGYWYTDEEKAKAGKKAFVVNRIGDFGFLLGMFMLFDHFGTLDFVGLHAAISAAPVAAATATTICLLLFVGCTGKSAQIPLYIWLPDAMAGPTPVSALIHAATMVTSGIYLVARMNFLYSLSPDALHVVAGIGAFTAFFAATIAITQRDIKKVLAYSTVSQLGYMFLGCGVGAYSAGVFHVITHAFFKALLFLGAGSVIHGMHEEQDIMKMGGLRTRMPQTFLVFTAGWLAICGIPPLAGFFSKDEILWQAFSSPNGSVVLWLIGALTAVMTAFYMTRLYSLTFLGTPRFAEAGHAHGAEPGKGPAKHQGHGHAPGHKDQKSDRDDHAHDHDHGHGHGGHGAHGAPGAAIAVHESPLIMTVPLMILAVLSVVGGFIGVPHMSWLEHWLEPVAPAAAHAVEAGGAMEWVLMAVSVAGAVFGVVVGLGLYKNLARAAALAKQFSGLHKLLDNKWYIDELFEAAFVRPIRALSEFLWKGFDVAVIDRVVLGFGRVSAWTGQTVRVIQTGSIQVYALFLFAGLLASVGYLIYGMA